MYGENNGSKYDLVALTIFKVIAVSLVACTNISAYVGSRVNHWNTNFNIHLWYVATVGNTTIEQHV